MAIGSKEFSNKIIRNYRTNFSSELEDRLRAGGLLM